MKSAKIILATVLVLGAVAASAQAFAHGGRGGGNVRFGVSIGVPLFWPHYYYGPSAYPYYYPPTVVVPASPPTYIEQGSPAGSPTEPAQSYWYFCPGSNTYYPYVKHCPGGWQRVEPQPPPG